MRFSKRSPDERSDIRTSGACPPHIAALMRATCQLGGQRLVDASKRATERCKTIRVDLGADHFGHDRRELS